jgi:hypothetical protein
MTKAEKRRFQKIQSLVAKIAQKDEELLDIFFRERPFLEDPSVKPEILDLSKETKEKELEKQQLVRELKAAMASEPGVQEEAPTGENPASADGVAKPLKCSVCGGTEFWKPKFGDLTCSICHPSIQGVQK